MIGHFGNTGTYGGVTVIIVAFCKYHVAVRCHGRIHCNSLVGLLLAVSASACSACACCPSSDQQTCPTTDSDGLVKAGAPPSPPPAVLLSVPSVSGGVLKRL